MSEQALFLAIARNRQSDFNRNERQNPKRDSVTSFQDLPNDLVRKILQHLSLAERFQLRGICKAWKRLVLEGLVSIDIRKTECFQKSRATVDSLNGLIARNQCTLCSLTIHLDHCDCYRGYGCKCQLPRISLLPSKRPLPASRELPF